MVRWYGTATLIKQRDSVGVEINSYSYFNLNAISFLLSIYSHLTFNSVVALRFFYDDNSFVLDETFMEGFINNFLELYFESNFSM